MSYIYPRRTVVKREVESSGNSVESILKEEKVKWEMNFFVLFQMIKSECYI